MLHIAVYGHAREILGEQEIRIALAPDQNCIRDVLDGLAAADARYAILLEDGLYYGLNDEIADASEPLRDGDRIAVFPALSGG